MGKREKEHNKKIRKRNEKLKQNEKQIQKIYTEMLSKKFMEMQEKLSGDTTSDESLNLDETLNVNDNRFIIPSKDGSINNNMIYFKEDGKYYKQTSSEFFKKIKTEIKIEEWKNAIEQNNLQVNKAISNLENGINVKVPISV